MKEFSEAEIERWSKKDETNLSVYKSYIQAKTNADKAFAEKDGSLTVGWGARRTWLRRHIGELMGY
jgi:hypothetical protein